MGKGNLSERDLRAILAFVRESYALQDSEGFIDAAIRGLPRLMASDLTAYCEIDPVAQTSRNWLDRADVDTAVARQVWEQHMLEMPVVAYYVGTGDGRALRVSDFISKRQFHDTGVYTEHYRPKRVEYVLATWVPSRRHAIGIGVHRDRRDYTDKERLILELLRPHLVQAWRNAQTATKLERASSLVRTFGALHPDVVVVDDKVRALYVGERARMLLHAHFGPRQQGESLPDPVMRWARTVAARFDERAEDIPVRRAPFVHDADGRQLVIRSFTSGRNTVLTVEERRARDPRRLAALGLTPRESEVLTWVAEGKRNQDIAAILHCATKTVEKHLEHVYEKLEVPNRAAAVAAAIAAMLAPTL